MHLDSLLAVISLPALWLVGLAVVRVRGPERPRFDHRLQPQVADPRSTYDTAEHDVGNGTDVRAA